MNGKLVRDKIPGIIRASGQRPITCTARPGEYEAALRDKLTEEVQEYLDGGDPAELADVLEVVYALADLDAITPAQLEQIRAAKVVERGAFIQRIIWRGNAT